MEEREFVAGSREVWARLAHSVKEARHVGVARMGAAELQRMHEDYRRTAADLAYAQTHFPGSESQTHLNRLVGQAHGELYGSGPRRLAAVWHFLASEFPALLRASWREIALSAALMCGAALIGFVLAHTDMGVARLLVPEQFREGVTERFTGPGGSDAGLEGLAPVLSAFIGVNNVRVALMAFAGGMTLGLLTVYSLLQNGAMVGVLAGMFSQARLSLPFWALIVPHGALELPAIVIAGAAGLKLAGATLFPGDLPRAASLKAAAPVAVRLVLGTIPMLAIAAAIEGFFTPRPLDPLLKLAVGGLVAATLAGYWALAGRARASR